MHKDEKDIPNKIQYSIWETKTEENLDTMKEEFTEAMEATKLQSKTTNQKD
ncbi:hypothetical protein [Bacillus sp. X1(2014)]|uniref:hypothetical protein n=1 Tax=Bacillus sp. X1(2014) TaxID=1565991 RepID=UPI0016434A0C|nr:hypothetical protein [Bacillus sp. X1(2014)]